MVASPPGKKNVWKEVKYGLIVLFILFLLFEMLASIVFFQRQAGGKFATYSLIEKFTTKKPDVSLYHEMHVRVRPDSSKEACIAIANEIWDANKYTYEPWLQFRTIDFKSPHVNVSGFERKTIPAEVSNGTSTDTLDVFFFGGSTMYGYNLSDAETIPSQFASVYKEKFPSGPNLRIRNFGVPYYFSKQELMLLTQLVFQGERPDVVIFMDGLNDFYPSRMLYFDRPHFTYAMQQVFDEKMFQKNRRTITDTSDRFYLDVPGVESTAYYNSLLAKYLNNIGQATSLCNKINAKSYFFCQPVPFFNYPNRSNDPISYKDNYPRYQHIYPLLQKHEQSMNNFVFLGNMLESEKGLPFVDQVHYSPSFARQISARMVDKVMSDFQTPMNNDGSKKTR
jgi:lysophospholipase L1-like esterase